MTLTVGSLFAAHLGRGFSETLSDLDALGFDAEWSTVSACSVGAAHPRRRLFAVAYSYGIGESVFAVDGEVAWLSELASRRRHWGNATADDVGTDDGVPHRLDRLRALGNAVVPQVAEFVGRRIVWAAA